MSNVPLVVKTVLLRCFSVCYFTEECNAGMLTRDNTLFTHIAIAHAFGMKTLFIRALATCKDKQLWMAFPKI